MLVKRGRKAIEKNINDGNEFQEPLPKVLTPILSGNMEHMGARPSLNSEGLHQ